MKISADIDNKIAKLHALLTPLIEEGLLVAFSGGVDSSYLTWQASQIQKQTHGKLLALTTDSASLAQPEKNDIVEFCQTYGIAHRWQPSNEFENPEYLKNDANRCYHCKSELFKISKAAIAELGFRHIAYGYNASDQGDERPGHKAARENNIHSPLAQAGLTKDEIRIIMRFNNILFADKPATPCLSSRVMRGVSVAPEVLKKIENLEGFLKAKNFKIFRVRHHHDANKQWLRLEVDQNEMAKVLAIHQEFVALAQTQGYQWVTLDLKGYQMGGANT